MKSAREVLSRNDVMDGIPELIHTVQVEATFPDNLMLVPREIDKMMIWTAAQIAEGRKKRGVKLNHPESVAYIANFVVEGARDGTSVADLMKSAREVLSRNDVMDGIPELIHTVQVEATFPDGTKLVTVHDPIQ
jgi:urease subunit gamma